MNNRNIEKAKTIQYNCMNLCKNGSLENPNRDTCYQECVQYKSAWSDYFDCYENGKWSSQRDECSPKFSGKDIPATLKYGEPFDL